MFEYHYAPTTGNWRRRWRGALFAGIEGFFAGYGFAVFIKAIL